MVDVIGSPATNVLSQFADIQKKVNEAIADVQKNREALEKNQNLKGPSGPVEEFQKTNSKSSSNLKAFATEVGILVKNHSRLNVISKLREGDELDYYKFRVTGSGEAFLGQVGDEGLRVQMLSQTGRVVADSNKDAGEAKERFDRLRDGTLELEAGEYHLRVSRDEDVDKSTSLNFALQLRMGDYKQDFDTVVNQPKPGDDPFAPSAATQELQSMLNSGASFFSSYQFGRSGTDKLMGNLFSGIF